MKVSQIHSYLCRFYSVERGTEVAVKAAMHSLALLPDWVHSIFSCQLPKVRMGDLRCTLPSFSNEYATMLT